MTRSENFYTFSNRANAIERMNELSDMLEEEKAKAPEERNPDREFQLLYARMIAGLKLNTGARLF